MVGQTKFIMRNLKALINQLKELKADNGKYWTERGDWQPQFVNALKIFRLTKVFKPSFDKRYTGDHQRFILGYKNCQSIMVWRRTKSPTGSDVMECIVFINKSFINNTDLIVDGVNLVRTMWPDLPLFVQIEPSRISSQTGACFEGAGWTRIDGQDPNSNSFQYPALNLDLFSTSQN